MVKVTAFHMERRKGSYYDVEYKRVEGFVPWPEGPKVGRGIERLVMKMLGLDNIKEAVLFPRTPERLVP